MGRYQNAAMTSHFKEAGMKDIASGHGEQSSDGPQLQALFKNQKMNHLEGYFSF